MIVGLRVIKTVIAVAISITIARLLHLPTDHFAGIVSMLAVQPSVYRSLHHSLSHIGSALLAAIIGITAALIFGNSSILIALVTLLVMIVHVRLKLTTSLTLAVIIAINTMGTSDEFVGGTAAYNQILLVLIGMTVGTTVNAFRKPKHTERAEVLLAKSETMLRALLLYVQLDLKAKSMTPYKPDMRLQIEEVREYIEKGKNISQLIREDGWFSKSNKESGLKEMFSVHETMIERIRDLVKALQKADLSHPESDRLARAIDIIVRGQERLIVQGKPLHFAFLLVTLTPAPPQTSPDHKEITRLFPYYQAYEALESYLRELETNGKQLRCREPLSSSVTYERVSPHATATSHRRNIHF